jgi:hypothetical protein
MRRLAAALVVAIAAAPLGAQRSTSLSSARFGVGFHFAIGHRSAMAALCDGSEMASVRSRRSLGKVLIIGGIAGGVVASTLTSNDYGKSLDVLTVSLLAATAGLYLHYNSNPSDQFWQSTMSQIKVGQTRSDDLRQCLGAPSGTTSSGVEETWTYQTAHSGFLGFGGSARSVSITMKDAVVSNVRKTDFAY